MSCIQRSRRRESESPAGHRGRLSAVIEEAICISKPAASALMLLKVDLSYFIFYHQYYFKVYDSPVGQPRLSRCPRDTVFSSRKKMQSSFVIVLYASSFQLISVGIMGQSAKRRTATDSPSYTRLFAIKMRCNMNTHLSYIFTCICKLSKSMDYGHINENRLASCGEILISICKS